VKALRKETEGKEERICERGVLYFKYFANGLHQIHLSVSSYAGQGALMLIARTAYCKTSPSDDKLC